MTALAADRDTAQRTNHDHEGPVAAAVEIFTGALLVRDSSGNIEPATTATGKVCCGVAAEYVDNLAGLAAAVNVAYKTGTFRFVNGSTITKAHIGDVAYAVDDQTISHVSTGKSACGIIVDVDSDGVWICVDPLVAAPTAGLLAANNLSDVASASTARDNLGLTDGSAALDLEDLDVDDDVTIGGLVTGLRKTQTVAANAYTVVSAADGDIVIAAAADNDVITLPDAAAANLGLRITVQNRGADGACKVSISPHSSDFIKGGVHGAAGGDLVSFSGTVDKDAINTKATAKLGDYLVLVSDGTTGWFVIGGKGVWASETEAVSKQQHPSNTNQHQERPR